MYYFTYRNFNSSFFSVVATWVVFMAPEVMNGEPYSEKADVYGYAMVLYEVLTGAEPFVEVPALELAMHVVQGKRPPITGACTSYTAYIALLGEAWHVDPAARPSLKEIILRLLQLREMPAPKPIVDQKVDLAALNGVLSAHPWFWGDTPKEKATEVLQGLPVGTFLVRNSSKPGCFAASVVFDNGVRHILIHPSPGGRYVIDSIKNRYNFKNLPSLVKCYGNILRTPAPKQL